MIAASPFGDDDAFGKIFTITGASIAAIVSTMY
jgi:hypothetical protein